MKRILFLLALLLCLLPPGVTKRELAGAHKEGSPSTPVSAKP